LGSGFWVQGSGFWVLGSGFWVQGSGFWVQGSGFRALGSGFRVLGSGFWVLSSGFWVQGFGFRVLGTAFSPAAGRRASNLIEKETLKNQISNIEKKISSAEVMYSVFYKIDRAKRNHPSKFVIRYSAVRCLQQGPAIDALDSIIII
jgi:hypothetical protein